jgi:N utilization substance protein A
MDSLIESLGLVSTEDKSALYPRVVTATVTAANADTATLRFDGPNGPVANAIMPVTEFYPNRRWAVGETYTLLQLDAGPRPLLSAVRPELVEALLIGISPEVRAGTVRVVKVARRAGLRTKIAVAATEAGTDPIAACVGRAHNRVDHLKDALSGEQVDIIAWHPDREVFLRNALQPAAVVDVAIDAEARTAVATAPAHQMSAAVGGGGLNSALAGHLVGVQVRIASAA